MRYYVIATGFILSVALLGCSSAGGLTKEGMAANEAVLRHAVGRREFVVKVDRMLPLNGRSQALTSPYSLEINGDRVKSYLPYFGRAYSVPYGGGDGLSFESAITDYTSEVDSKGKTTVAFQTSTKEDRHVFRIEIFPDGSTFVNVTSVNRQAISFRGSASAGTNGYNKPAD
jgi:hypothetical protein